MLYRCTKRERRGSVSFARHQSQLTLACTHLLKVGEPVIESLQLVALERRVITDGIFGLE